MDYGLWEISIPKDNFRHSVSAVLEQERTVVSICHAYCHRGGNCELLPSVHLLSTDSILTLSSHR